MMESYDSITFAAALAKLGMSKDASSGLRFVSRRFEENDVVYTPPSLVQFLK